MTIKMYMKLNTSFLSFLSLKTTYDYQTYSVRKEFELNLIDETNLIHCSKGRHSEKYGSVGSRDLKIV